MLSRTALHPRTRFRLQVAGFLLTFALISAAYATIALAYQSDHAQLVLVWNDGQHDCSDVPMQLVDDHVWECSIPVEAGLTYYCQFWTGDVNAPKYGADLFDPAGLVLDIDPSSLVVQFPEPGYRTIRVSEATTTFYTERAPGSIVLEVLFSDAPALPPADLRAAVSDQTTGLFLGDYLPGTGTPFELGGLMKNRTYAITVTAAGYDTEQFELFVLDETPVPYSLTLQRNVADEQTTWGGLKTIYRR